MAKGPHGVSPGGDQSRGWPTVRRSHRAVADRGLPGPRRSAAPARVLGTPTRAQQDWRHRDPGRHGAGAGPSGSRIYAAGADQDQAGLLLDDVRGKFLRSPILAPLVKLTRTTLTVTATGSTLIVLAANAPSAYGLRPDMIVVDELAEWRRRELWDSLWSATGKRPRCRLLAISTAGWDQTSIAWEVRQIAEREADWYFSTRGPCASWVSDTWREQQRRTLPPHVFARLHLNEWVTGVGAFLTSQEVDSIFVEALPAGIDAQGESRPRTDTRRITRPACRWLYGSWQSAPRGRSSGSRTSRPRTSAGRSRRYP